MQNKKHFIISIFAVLFLVACGQDLAPKENSNEQDLKPAISQNQAQQNPEVITSSEEATPTQKIETTDNQPQQIQAQKPSVLSSQPADTNTADWQIYKNDKYGFEFKYPKEWVVTNDKESGNSYVVEIFGKNIKEEPALKIEINPDGSDYPASTLYEAEENKGKIVIKSKKDFEICEESENNHCEWSMTDQKENYKKLIMVSTFLGRDKNNYSIIFAYNKNGKDFQQIFDQILSTFRFTK